MDFENSGKQKINWHKPTRIEEYKSEEYDV